MGEHSFCGDLGDLVFALCAIKASGGGSLKLFPLSDRTTHLMTRERADSILPLIRSQPYITGASFDPDAKDSPLNQWRGRSGGNIADKCLNALGLHWTHRNDAWLTIDRPIKHSVIFARSERYNNPRFPWRLIADKYRGQASFVGLPAEHERFCRQFGEVPFVETIDLLEVARHIAGCDLIVCNQSCPNAIAEGLKKNMILEVSPQFKTSCDFRRLGLVLGVDEQIELPQLDNGHG